jgi:cell division protease FtsH
MIFDDISTGAQNDLERATEIARSMVMDYGMSRLGRVNYRESNRSPFLTAGGDVPAMQHHSEQTAREIDEEVKRITDDSLVQTRKILERRKDALVAVTEALLEHEVIDSGQLAELIEKHSPGPMIAAGTEGERKPSARPSQSDADLPSPAEPARASGDVD